MDPLVFVTTMYNIYVCNINVIRYVASICIPKAMATSPFVFGTRVSGENFTDRVKETKRLKINFENGINTVLISPRRMGKTSLVAKAVSLLTDDNFRRWFRARFARP